MPIFHCPIGSPYYDSEVCILCNLCLATNKEERIAATEKIRDYMRTRAELRESGTIKKIAVCGKGGVGKSTITNLMANAMRDLGYRVLVLDTDESNPGLYRMFGFDREPKPLITLLTRFAENDTESSADWLKRDEISSEDIPSEYILENNGIKFLMVGKIADPLEGCACTMADLTRKFMGSLVIRNKEIVLADMEAGIESFGRGVEREVDTVLIIVEPSFESIALAGKIKYMADGIGVNKVRALVNKVPSEEIEKHILEELGKKEIISIGTVFQDSRIYEANLRGDTLGDSDAMRAVLGISRCLLN